MRMWKWVHNPKLASVYSELINKLPSLFHLQVGLLPANGAPLQWCKLWFAQASISSIYIETPGSMLSCMWAKLQGSL